ncbi:MAG: RCC1 repeat-containing protein, partial [Deltaproteobacteria bacterium]|nr:RCC1 repeat-containing protein [Deltaproteobacteria bacterium]
SALSGATALAAGGFHSLGLKADGTVWAWGGNGEGELGDGTTTTRSIPVQVAGLSGMAAVAAGWQHSLALRLDGTVWAWGDNSHGQLGIGMLSVQSLPPVQVRDPRDRTGFLTGVTAIAAGIVHNVALKADGTVWAWGNSDQGQVGDGTFGLNNIKPTPIQVRGPGGIPFPAPVTAVAAWGFHSLVLLANDTVWAWGQNIDAQLGDNTTARKATPVQVHALANVMGIAAGGRHSLAMRFDGTVWAWGSNHFGQVGDGTPVNIWLTPRPVGDPRDPTWFQTGATALAAGVEHNLAVKSDGTVWAWGRNTAGELGNGSTTHARAPVQVQDTGPQGLFLMGTTAIAAGAHSLAVLP